MILGTLGPLAALYHCNFTAGAVNSRVALFAALAVAGSGFVGRYIYSKIHHGLYGRRANLKELLARVELAAPAAAQVALFVPELTRRSIEFDRTVLVPPSGLLASFMLPFRLARDHASAVLAAHAFHASRPVRRIALYSPRLAQNGRRLEQITRGYVARHLREVRRVAEFTAYQRLFALWHVVHRPFFVILLLSVAIHVFAVHYY